jgi:hypothetical protein
VDFDIYDRCLLRIGLFRQSLGGSEEILGRISRELRSVAESLELTAAERQERLQQLTDNEIRLLQEQEKLEEHQAELFGIVLPPQQIEQEIRDASSAWLTPQALQNLIQSYLVATCGGDDHILGERPLKTLRLSQEARNRLLEDFRKLPRQASPLYRDWEKWLKGSDYRLDITFDATCAAEHRHATFITPIHPLAQQAALIQQDMPPFYTAFAVTSSEVASGVHPFAIYQWAKRGVREDSLLQPVLADATMTDKFLTFLEQARPTAFSPADFPQQAVLDELENEHYKRWAHAQEVHRQYTRRIAQYRKESLRVSHESRMALLREQYAQVTEERIRRMREAQIAAAEADYTRHLAEIEAAESHADILSRIVAYGVMIVETEA